MGFDLVKEFNRCGSVCSSFTRLEYIEWTAMVLTDGLSRPDVLALLVPTGTVKRTAASSRYAVLESWTFKLASGELVRVHWHTPDPLAPAGSKSNVSDIVRIQVDVEFLCFDGVNVKAHDLISLQSDPTLSDMSHIPLATSCRQDIEVARGLCDSQQFFYFLFDTFIVSFFFILIYYLVIFQFFQLVIYCYPLITYYFL